MDELTAGNVPTDENKVTLSFLGDQYLAGSVIDLGIHLIDKTQIVNRNVEFENYDDDRKYTFIKDGFQTLTFESHVLESLRPIYKISNELSPHTQGPSDEDKEIQDCIDILQQWIKKKYVELTGEQNITCVCSRHLIMRITGCDTPSCQIPGNPLMHLDYISFDKAYERQCQEQEKQPLPVVCPTLDKLIDVVNIWFPSKIIKDWPLGFIDGENIQIMDYVPIELVVGSKAASLRHKPDLRVIYKKNMDVPQVYLFRSATKDASKKGVFHGSFRITDDIIERRSIELRCCVFKNNLPGGKSRKKRRTCVRRRTRRKPKF
jgi:hypothetical protein